MRSVLPHRAPGPYRSFLSSARRVGLGAGAWRVRLFAEGARGLPERGVGCFLDAPAPVRGGRALRAANRGPVTPGPSGATSTRSVVISTTRFVLFCRGEGLSLCQLIGRCRAFGVVPEHRRCGCHWTAAGAVPRPPLRQECVLQWRILFFRKPDMMGGLEPPPPPNAHPPPLYTRFVGGFTDI